MNRDFVASSGDLLARRVEQASPGRLVSVTVEVDIADPCAAVFASRRADDNFFCWEQPDRGFALAGLGVAADARSRGPRRFDDIAARCAEVMRGREADEPAGLPAGAGPVWVGGFAFDPEGARVSHWSSFAPAQFALPELSLARVGGKTYLTLSAVARDGGSAEAPLRRLASLAEEPLPMADPHPTDRARIESVQPPERYEDAVAGAVERIARGEFEKTVLAREVTVEAAAAHRPAAIFGSLRDVFPSCFCFCVGTPEAAFIGASPELLLRREGAGLATVALAGSTRRSADPAVDSHLGERLLRSAKDRSEHAIVARRIERSLRREAVWVQAEPEPVVVQVANIQHLATPIRAQLAEPRSALDLAGALHPTPAVGGEPREPALRAIAELEGMDRGWFAAPVGWMDSAEDGELCVALRSALLRDRVAHLYAGAGIVADSDPAAELAETELKLDALMPLVAS